MLAIACRAVVITGVPRRRIDRVHQRHVTFPAGNGLGRVAFVIPAALSPVVVLVLQLHPADLIDFFVDELLVAGGAELGRFIQRACESCFVLFGINANQKITHPLVRRTFLPFADVAYRLAHRVIRVAADVRLNDGMAANTGHALVGPDRGQTLDIHVLIAG